MKIKKLNNGISSISNETKILVEKGTTLVSECTLDVHGYIKGNIKGKFIKIGPKGKIDGNLDAFFHNSKRFLKTGDPHETSYFTYRKLLFHF